MTNREKIINCLQTIIDPELGIDIWTMGLIYEIEAKDDKTADIRMTFTSPLCPAGPYLEQEIKESLKSIGCEEVNIDITFDPPWRPSPDLRAALGI